MIIQAKFDGRCPKCGKPTPKGSQIDYTEGKAWHPGCAPKEESGLSDEEQVALADRLGYRHYSHDELRSSEVDDGGQVRDMPGESGIEEPRSGSPSRGLEDRLPGMSEEEEE